MDEPSTFDTSQRVNPKKKTKKRSSKKKISAGTTLDQENSESNDNSNISLKQKVSTTIPKIDDTNTRSQPPTPNNTRSKNSLQTQSNRSFQSEIEPVKSNSVTCNGTPSLSIESTCNTKTIPGSESHSEDDTGDVLVKTYSSKEIKTSNVPRMMPSIPKTEKSYTSTATGSGSLKIPRLRANSARNMNKTDVTDQATTEDRPVSAQTSKVLKTHTQIKKVSQIQSIEPSTEMVSNKNIPSKNPPSSSNSGKNLLPKSSTEFTSTFNENNEKDKSQVENISSQMTSTKDLAQTPSTLVETESTKVTKKLQVSRISRENNNGAIANVANISESAIEIDKVYLNTAENFSPEVEVEEVDSKAVPLGKSLSELSPEIILTKIARRSSHTKHPHDKNNKRSNSSDAKILASQLKPSVVNILIGPEGNIVSTAVIQPHICEDGFKIHQSDVKMNAVGTLSEEGLKISVGITDPKLLSSIRRTDDLSINPSKIAIPRTTPTKKAAGSSKATQRSNKNLTERGFLNEQSDIINSELAFLKTRELQAINNTTDRVSDEIISSSSINVPVMTPSFENTVPSTDKDANPQCTTKDASVRMVLVSEESIVCLHKKVESIEKNIQKLTAALSIQPVNSDINKEPRSPSQKRNSSDHCQKISQKSLSSNENIETDVGSSKATGTKMLGKTSSGWNLMWPFSDASIGPTTNLTINSSCHNTSLTALADKSKMKEIGLTKQYKVIGRVGRK
ncbi:hypothetical protein K3495_g7172 [Podosphaera aphanis]|nr:hypothetical protein K3495_g7172 [Podosphaera aphanis]